jgi:Lrp/AsnC family transcriptional regulator, leucine-responsive regulatory protein
LPSILDLSRHGQPPLVWICGRRVRTLVDFQEALIENNRAEAQNYCVCTGPRSVALDEIDHDLLALLQEDAARTLREFGEAVRLSPSAVQRRIARYQPAGLIAREVAVLDSRSVGGPLRAVVLAALAQESTGYHDALRARLLAAPEVQQCYDVAGERGASPVGSRCL